MRRSRNSSSENSGCITIIIILIINVTVGAWSVMEILSWFDKSIPFIANAAIGLFVSEVSIPIAIAGYVLRACGVF